MIPSRTIGSRLLATSSLSRPHTQALPCLSSSSIVPALASASVSLSLDPSSSSIPHLRQQVRWKRRDGNRWSRYVKPPSKVQRKKHSRKLKAIQAEKDKHSPPGKYAGPERERRERERQELLNPDTSENILLRDKNVYEEGDALLDDLMGNSNHALPTPEPAYFGHKQRKFFNIVADHMDDYRNYMAQLETGDPRRTALMLPVDLPSDRDISMALRAFRDRRGTRQRPVGIVAALGHLLTDLKLPLAALKQVTYNTLLTCCRSPTEARRVFSMMQEHSIPLDKYSWSILVDVHAKVGDYKGCAAVHQEMLNASPEHGGGHAPTLASYTSLLVACYKICINGRVAHSIRADAAKVGWEQWQEMQIVGIRPDAMAYGAMLRLLSAQGQPERALSLLHDMERMQVAPTTLCFSSALRAVAKSHATAIRYERGASRRHRRRETTCAHHGKLAREIVVLAENADVNMDEGFVAALILCAAEAGDVATCKAIAVAAEIRKLDWMRTVGSEAHLARLRGDTSYNEEYDNNNSSSLLLPTGGSSALRPVNRRKSFGEREYGKDTRVLSAILHGCSRAVDKNGMGTIWQGRENEGYTCINSLRLIQAPRLPRYKENTIPNQNITSNLTYTKKFLNNEHERNNKTGGKYKRTKYSIIEEDETTGGTLDDLDHQFSRFFLDDNGELLDEYRKTTPEEIWQEKYGENAMVNRPNVTEERLLRERKENDEALTQALVDDEDVPDDRPQLLAAASAHDGEPNAATNGGISAASGGNVAASPATNSKKEWSIPETIFESDALESSRASYQNVVGDVPNLSDVLPKDVALGIQKESKGVQNNTSKQPTKQEALETNEKDFQTFFEELRQELIQSGEEDVLEEEARELFAMMQDEYKDSGSADIDDISVDGRNREDEFYGIKNPESNVTSGVEDLTSNPAHKLDPSFDAVRETALKQQDELNSTAPDKDFSEVMGGILDKWGIDEQGQRNSSPTIIDNVDTMALSQQTEEHSSAATQQVNISPEDYYEHVGQIQNSMSTGTSDSAMTDGAYSEILQSFQDGKEELPDEQIEELRRMFPNFSDFRLKKIQEVFQSSLGNAPMLELIMVVRENMPDYITGPWLQKMSTMTTKFVMMKASRDGLVDRNTLTGVLSVLTASGSIDRAIEFHETDFEKHGVAPTQYCDRLVLQMLLNNNRFTRALAFKQKTEESGRSLDIKAYGSLIEYCSRRNQLGSAMLLVKECLSVHGAPPGEASLKHVRLLCRQTGVGDDIKLDDLIGPDPLEWLRHGEHHLKREMSKKGRQHLQYVKNAVLRT